MLGRIASVGGFTLLSRVAGFARDIMLAAILGAGPIADAFFVALRLPNHFRAIFAEGAFQAAFVPAYTRIRTQDGADKARIFGDRVFTLLFITQVALLVAALAFTPSVIRLLAPGYDNDPQRFALATELTRITFPYLMLMTLVTLLGGMLNAIGRFASAAAAPILLNLTMMVTLALAAFFPTTGHAAAWGVLIAGVLEFLLLAADAKRHGVMARFRQPILDPDLRKFFRALGPAVIGRGGVQVAMFADTIIATFLPIGAVSALYYADRIYQLPIGVIAIAAGTVLVPEMARRIAGGDDAGARRAQINVINLTLLLSVPCVAAFLAVPDLIMRALFLRGAFTAADAANSGATLSAYAVGLIATMLIACMTPTFYARGDTTTPMKASLIAIAVNIAFKVLLMGTLAQTGLALATSIGAWVNVLLLILLAARAGLFVIDRALMINTAKMLAAGLVLGIVLWLLQKPVGVLFSSTIRWHEELTLAVLGLSGLCVYLLALLALFGRSLGKLVRRAQ
ncbi:putative peptidoglycan biosynthesis protein MurJ [Variibacter gotjawalensis]|uniref:Probable lipid II flippase MurJ n=1 Tax=Variibacter gotjawalensis TaxID=1333996 RepID=A0A0S3PUM7_9BRAD|nr:murein biosynthesis integral membrane protein MurJ [Variibacter gotjawalensis]NIK49991.1 putative peptidoglycan lipid II flippase [Variibacter gotjawalensis]RZS45990.1 putative peptidoglycan lipid II flippase [Variibacter gotjawalensis]BAT59665.1 putative peptidoglycan biosynthesis protein MurJ [Variibacter gotjawalensis]